MDDKGRKTILLVEDELLISMTEKLELQEKGGHSGMLGNVNK